MTHVATARRTLLGTAAIALMLTTAACGGSDTDTVAKPAKVPVKVDAPVTVADPVAPAKPAAAPVKPAVKAAAPTGALPDGTFQVHVVRAKDGALVLDRGRFVQGEPREPGVDSTAPITFDTGKASERRSTPVADDARLEMQVAGKGTTRVTYAELAAAVAGSDGPYLATVTVSGGEVQALSQLYRA